ncbi:MULTISPECIES: hypothetical protein [Cerasicoccaceae]|uniref:hypothetical protein n=1 Tax=Cerasicoccaceae TaxID=3056374 RepID=UPI001C72D622|nr:MULTISPECIES: hypothetical protein [Cerasicoccaceae]QYY35453.1 hypothetical protein K0V07_14290 [Ruficoccus sp. ZRK36]
MDMKLQSDTSGFLSMLIQHPAIQGDIASFASAIIRQALTDSSIRRQVIDSIPKSEIIEIIGANAPVEKSEKSNVPEKLGRQQISGRDAARILGYNPRYFSRRAKDWGLTKIRMSRTSCRYYLDEVNRIAEERGIRKAT